MKITLVKKMLPNGLPCRKCIEVMDKMKTANQLQFIDEIVVADEKDKNSPGMVLAIKHDVNRAPFFVVEYDDGSVEVFTVYLKLAKEVLSTFKETA